MTRLEMQTAVFDLLQSNSSGAGAGVWTPSEVQQYIRDYELKLFVMIAGVHENFFRTTTTLSEVAGTATVDLPTNNYRILELERISGAGSSAVNPIPMVAISRTSDARDHARGTVLPIDSSGSRAYPVHFLTHGQKQIELVPVPSVSVTNSLKLGYVYRPAAMTADSHVPFQLSAGTGGTGTDNLAEFHDIIVLGAAEKAMLKEEGYPQMDRIQSMRREREAELVRYLKSMQVQGPRYIGAAEREFFW